MEFKYDGGAWPRAGVSLFVDGKKDGEGRVDRTVPMMFSADETCDVGNRLAGLSGLRADRQRVQRRNQMGTDRSGKGRSRPLDRSRGAVATRDGAAVKAFSTGGS